MFTNTKQGNLLLEKFDRENEKGLPGQFSRESAIKPFCKLFELGRQRMGIFKDESIPAQKSRTTILAAAASENYREMIRRVFQASTSRGGGVARGELTADCGEPV
jgi:hypothetical protein